MNAGNSWCSIHQWSAPTTLESVKGLVIVISSCLKQAVLVCWIKNTSKQLIRPPCPNLINITWGQWKITSAEVLFFSFPCDLAWSYMVYNGIVLNKSMWLHYPYFVKNMVTNICMQENLEFLMQSIKHQFSRIHNKQTENGLLITRLKFSNTASNFNKIS